MNVFERPGKILLTLSEAARRLGLNDSMFADMVLCHPPILDIMLIGRAPRVYTYQLNILRRRWVTTTIQLIQCKPALLEVALGIVRAGEHYLTETSRHTGSRDTELRAILVESASGLLGRRDEASTSGKVAR